MRYIALACDYDGTIARDGKVDEKTLRSLEQLSASGRTLILVTGRKLADLLNIFPAVEIFDRVVAENGAVLYCPASKQTKCLAEAPNELLIRQLETKGVTPLSAGMSIIATHVPHETTILEEIHAMGLELQVIFNKGAVMILPGGVNKASGLTAALADLSLSPHNTVGIGDAENDHTFLSLCECSAAVSNALPAIKERVDLVMLGVHGAGAVELIDKLISSDLIEAEDKLKRHHVLLGKQENDENIYLKPSGTSLLVAGPSGSGKSTTTLGIIERLTEAKYQYCLIDPEGDYEEVEGAISLGTKKIPPSMDEILGILKNPHENLIINLLGIPLADRPAFFSSLLPHLAELKTKTGRPHWLILDEAHHILPADWRQPFSTDLPEAGSIMLITVHPDHLAASTLEAINTVLAVGNFPEQTLRAFSKTLNIEMPHMEFLKRDTHQAIGWFRGEGMHTRVITVAPPLLEHRRHQRKYAEGDIGHEKSFFFRGPEGKLNLQAQNLNLFIQIAQGVDDDTWLFHLRKKHYSQWLENSIKDATLAKEVARIENQSNLSAKQSRKLVKMIIEERYSAPA